MADGQMRGSGTVYSKIQLLIILLTPLLVMASATGLYYSGWLTPDERVNRGTLIDPVLHLSDLGLDPDAVNPERQWLMVQTSMDCGADCRDRVHNQRQIHVALGKYQPRLKRVLLTGSADLESLAGDYPALDIVTRSRTAFSEAFRNRVPEPFSDHHFVFLVDPLGNVLLYFTPENDYKDQLADIKKLLKLSTIG